MSQYSTSTVYCNTIVMHTCIPTPVAYQIPPPQAYLKPTPSSKILIYLYYAIHE